MDDNVFRIVITAGVAIAAAAFVAQAWAMVALFRSVRAMQRKTEPFIEQARPVLAQAGAAVREGVESGGGGRAGHRQGRTPFSKRPGPRWKKRAAS